MGPVELDRAHDLHLASSAPHTADYPINITRVSVKKVGQGISPTGQRHRSLNGKTARTVFTDDRYRIRLVTTGDC
jgi:hypothetical protein